MKINIKNIYGIRDELILETTSKKTKQMNRHIIAFAPNGTGKTSLTKGIDDLLNDRKHFPLNDDEEYDYKLEVTFKGNTYSYDNLNGSKMQNEVAILNKDNLLADLKEIKEYLGGYKEDSSGNLNYDKINEFGMRFSKTIQEDNLGMFCNKNTNSSTSEWIEYFEKEIENMSEDLIIHPKRDHQTLNQDILGLEKAKTMVEKVIKEVGGSKKMGSYIDVIRNNVNPESETYDVLINASIIKEIKNLKKDKQDDFGFKIENEYKGISSIEDKQVHETLEKFTENEVEFILELNKSEILQEAIAGFNKDNTLKKVNTNISGNIKKIDDSINYFKRQKFYLHIKHFEKEYESIKAEYDKTLVETIDKINEKFEKINNFFNKNSFDWKVEIKKITSLSEEVNPMIKYEGITYDQKIFYEYASEGQKNVLKLIATLIKYYEKDMTLILDDLFSSMDYHHSNELMEVLCAEAFKDIDFLILTHSFQWVKMASFNKAISSEASFIVLDKIDQDKILKIEASHSDMSTLMYSNKPKDNSLITLFSEINKIRELVNNDLATKLMGKNIPKTDNHYHLKQFVDFCDQNIRHYKRNIKVKDVLKSFEDKLSTGNSPLPIYLFPVVGRIEVILRELNKVHSNDVFGDLVIGTDINWESAVTVDDYISHKIFCGSKIRFINEEFKYYSNNKELIKPPKDKTIVLEVDKWESLDQWSKSRPVQIIKPSNDAVPAYKINFLAHADNAQWTFLVETPIYKILKYYPKIKNTEDSE